VKDRLNYVLFRGAFPEVNSEGVAAGFASTQGIEGMRSNHAEAGWLTRERLLTAVLAIATLLALYVCYLVIEPFVPALAFALALAVATNRIYKALLRRFRRPTVSAAVTVVLVAQHGYEHG
jgi:hypothetical protein